MTSSKVLNKNSLSCFRTKMCNSYMEGTCKFKEAGCLYSHCPICIRRCPFYLSDTSFIRYIPVLCRNIVFGPDFKVIASNCPYKNDCIYSHCLDELLYHPTFYKTITCKDMLEGDCTHPFCPFIHKRSEQRALRHYKVPFAKGLEIPPIRYITLVNRMIHTKGHSEASRKAALSTKSATSDTSCSSESNEDFECKGDDMVKELRSLQIRR